MKRLLVSLIAVCSLGLTAGAFADDGCGSCGDSGTTTSQGSDCGGCGCGGDEDES